MGKRKSFFKSGRREDSPFKTAVSYLILSSACLIAVYPLLRVFSISVRPGDRLLSTDLRIIPLDATWNNYIRVLFETNFLIWVWNSLAISIVTSLIGVVLAASAGYAFSRFRFPGRRSGLVFLLTTQMTPAAMLLIPLYIMLARLHLINTYFGLMVAYSVTALPFSTWILKGYFDTIPIDLEEAAMVDGSSQLGPSGVLSCPSPSPH